MQIFGTVTNAVKNMALSAKANRRMQNPYEAKGSSSPIERPDPKQTEISNKIVSIQGKMKAGKRLSASDKEFLREHAPSLYDKAVRIEKERDQFNERLRHCKTKEDVRRLYMEKAQQLDAEVKSVERSSMSAGEKMEALEFIGMRMAAIQDEFMVFTGTPEYKRLPERKDEEEDDKSTRKRAVKQEKKDPLEHIKKDGETAAWPPEQSEELPEIGLPGKEAGSKAEKAPSEARTQVPDGQRRRAVEAYTKAAGSEAAK